LDEAEGYREHLRTPRWEVVLSELVIEP